VHRPTDRPSNYHFPRMDVSRHRRAHPQHHGVGAANASVQMSIDSQRSGRIHITRHRELGVEK